MRPSLRSATALIALAVLVGGCGAGPDGSTTTPSPSASSAPAQTGTGVEEADPAVLGRIPTRVRRELPRTPALRSVWRNRAEFIADSDGPRRALVRRRMAPCDRGGSWLSFDADLDVLDYAQGVRRDGDLLASRQLTLYPDTDAAEEFLAEAGRSSAVCARIGGRDVRESSTAAFATARDLGREDLPASARVSDTVYDLGSRDLVLHTDVLARRGNAVVWTRVVDLGATGTAGAGTHDDIADPAYERLVVTAAARSSELLGRLRPRRTGE